MPELRRVTTNYIPTASEALDKAAERERLSITDVANRAVILYEWVGRELEQGSRLFIRDANDETFLVKLL